MIVCDVCRRFSKPSPAVLVMCREREIVSRRVDVVMNRDAL